MIQGLYNTLFETIESVKKGEIDIEKAEIISKLGQTIINAGKLEVSVMKERTNYNTTLLSREEEPKEAISAKSIAAINETYGINK